MAFSRWSLIIDRARNRLQEPSPVFYDDTRMRDYGKQGQVEIAHILEPLEGVYTVASVADQSDYDLPVNCIRPFQVAYNGDYVDDDLQFSETLVGNYPSATPTSWCMADENTVRLYPAPSTADEDIDIYYKKRPSMGAIRLYHDGGASSTAATCEVKRDAGTMTAATMDMVITGGTNAGTTTYTFSEAASDTITEVVAAINATAEGWTAVLDGTCNGADSTTTLEVSESAVSVYKLWKTIDAEVALESQLDELIELYIVKEGLAKDTEYEEAGYYEKLYQRKLAYHQATYWRRRKPVWRDIYSDVPAGWTRLSATGRIFIP